ncbi:MAG: hypothetical protein Tsb009_27670 [Planctomycetaceae bacterium]
MSLRRDIHLRMSFQIRDINSHADFAGNWEIAGRPRGRTVHVAEYAIDDSFDAPHWVLVIHSALHDVVRAESGDGGN